MKNLKTYINERFTTSNDDIIEIEDYLKDIVNNAKEEPEIYDDSENWEANEYFDYWENEFGDSDDVLDYIIEYANYTCVAGWFTKKSFEETEKIIPQKLIDIMKNNTSEIPYKNKHIHNQMEVWETKDKGFDVTVLKFKNHVNDFGTDYIQFWYMIAVEE